MTETRTEKEQKLSDEERRTLVGLLEVHGFQELSSANLFASGVRLAPTLDEKQLLAEQARDELHHFEVVAVLYDVLAGDDLVQVVKERVEAVPQPGNWVEMAVVAFLSDRVGNALLAAGSESGYRAYAGAVRRIFEGEHEHQRVTEAILKEVCAGDQKARLQAQRYLMSWLRASLSELAGETVNLFARAKELGLLRHDADEIRRGLLERLAPEILRAGLDPPTLADLEVDEPDA